MVFELLIEVLELVLLLLLQVADRDVGHLFDDLLHVGGRDRGGLVGVVFLGVLLGLGQPINLVAVEGGLFVVL